VIADRFKELKSELPLGELDDLRSLSIELYEQHDDESAIALWAGYRFSWDLDRLGEEQRRQRGIYESTTDGMFDERATVEGITLAKARLEAAREVAIDLIELIEQSSETLRDRLTVTGLEESLVEDYVEDLKQNMDPATLAATARKTSLPSRRACGASVKRSPW
jgi:hypothetical protein